LKPESKKPNTLSAKIYTHFLEPVDKKHPKKHPIKKHPKCSKQITSWNLSTGQVLISAIYPM